MSRTNTKPKINLVFGICYTNPNFLVSTVKSLLDGSVTPTDIVIADYGLNLTPSLKKRDHVSVIKTPNYGMLSSLYAILQKYGKTPAVHIILVDEAVTYMPHLAAEYLNTTAEILKEMKIKFQKDDISAAFGLTGLILKENKQHDLDNELESLISGSDDDISGSGGSGGTRVVFKRNYPTTTTNTMPVDLLEFTGSIYITANQVSELASSDVFKKPISYNRFQASVVLSSFLAKKNIYRVNVCHLGNNRFIMERIGCFSHAQKHEATEYVKAIEEGGIETVTNLRLNAADL
jgi:hypothetical protein